MDLDDGGDGVWSKDIEDAFEEALQIYPPCGRRKIILSDEGKMYGRNELIARYIKMRTGKSRSRKQVSSHIQVLARKKQREVSTQFKMNPEMGQMQPAFQGMSSAEIVSQSLSRDRTLSMPSSASRGHQHDLGGSSSFLDSPASYGGGSVFGWGYGMASPSPVSRLLSHNTMRVCMEHFSATVDVLQPGHVHQFLALTSSDHFTDTEMEAIDMTQVIDKFPDLRHDYQLGPAQSFFLAKFWVDMGFDPHSVAGPFAHAARYHSLEALPLLLTTRVYSNGKEILSKDQVAEPVPDNMSGGYLYLFERAPLCPYLATFVGRLRSLDNRERMNAVLEGFQVVQTAHNASTGEILFLTAFVFEVAQPGMGPRTQVYKLYDSTTDMRRCYTA